MKVCIQTVKPRARLQRFYRDGVLVAQYWYVRCPIAEGTHPDINEAIACWRANRLYTQHKLIEWCK